jgi:hypothetical protein
VREQGKGREQGGWRVCESSRRRAPLLFPFPLPPPPTPTLATACLLAARKASGTISPPSHNGPLSSVRLAASRSCHCFKRSARSEIQEDTFRQPVVYVRSQVAGTTSDRRGGTGTGQGTWGMGYNRVLLQKGACHGEVGGGKGMTGSGNGADGQRTIP